MKIKGVIIILRFFFTSVLNKKAKKWLKNFCILYQSKKATKYADNPSIKEWA